MRSRLLASSMLAVLAGITGCDGGGGAACVMDSDCADLGHACLEGQCRRPSVVMDAGRPDAGGPRDAGPRDSGPPPEEDAGLDDAGEPEDGGAIPLCTDVSGSYVVSAVPVAAACGAAAVGHGLTIAVGATACEFVAASVDIGATPAIDGTFTLAADGSLAGTMQPGGGAAVECMGQLMDTTLTFSCASFTCIIQVTAI